jgi:hypothetical protein
MVIRSPLSFGLARARRAGAVNEEGAMITAHDLSLAYVQAVSAYWRGDSELLPQFDAWLAGFWTTGPAEPAAEPQAQCPHAAAGRGIRWHEHGSALLGFVPGKRGCFRIPRTAVLPRESRARGSGTAAPPIAA